ncbi:MAG: dihydroneopterin aldolase, partial [Ruminococcus sp.]|nr:dihydroneopterin aldolase [Ruminococcus sp.]
MDVIKIKDLEIFSNHGVLKEENVLGQKFLISADIYLDTQKAGSTDDISDSVDYSQICHLIKKIMESNTFKLIETAAEKLSHDILSHYSRINRVVLEVKKPWAPILLPLEYISVTVDRKWSKVYLSLGSNMGDKEKYIKDAIDLIR